MKIQLKRSSALAGGKAKEPTAGQTEFGELCVNFNSADPSLFIRDSDDNIVRLAGVGSEGIYWELNGNTLSPIDPLYEVNIGDGNIVLAADGKVTFAGGTHVFNVDGSASLVNGLVTLSNAGAATFGGGNIELKETGIAEFTDSQSIKLRPTLANASTGYAIALFAEDGSTTQFAVNANGSGSFAGKVTSASTEIGDPVNTLVTKDYLSTTAGGGTGAFGYWYRNSGTLTPFNNTDSVEIGQGAVIKLNSSGNIEIGGGISAADGYGTRIEDGQIIFRNDNASATGCVRVLKGGDDPTANLTAAIYNDGTGSFQKLGVNYSNTLNLPLTVGGNGEVAAFTNSAGASLNINLGLSTGVAEIASNGSTSTFELTCNNNKNITLNNDGTTFFGGKATMPSTTSADGGTTLATKDYVDANSGGSTSVGPNPPSNANDGDLWWDTNDGRLYIYYNDGDTEQWVDASPEGGGSGGSGDASVSVSENPPSNPSSGDLWWNSDDGEDGGGRLYIYYNDGNTSQWVDASLPGGSGSGGGGDFYAGASAWGVVQGGGGLSAGLNCTSVRNSVGNYTVTFKHPMPSDVYSITTGNLQAKSIVEIVSQTATGFNYLRKSPDSGTPTDLKTAFTVHATNALPPRGGTGADAWGCIDPGGALLSGMNIDRAVHQGTGETYVYFTTPMPTADYAVAACCSEKVVALSSIQCQVSEKTTEYFKVSVLEDTGVTIAGTDRAFDFVVHATNARLPDTVTQEQLDAVLDNWERDGTTLKPVNIGDDIVGVGDVVATDALVIKDANDIIISGCVKTVLSQDGGAFIYQHPNQANFNQILQDGTNGNVLFGSASSIYATIDNDTGDYNAVSDVKLKSNINELNAEQILDKVSKLKPSSYVMKGVSTTGFVAQEVEPLFPNLVGEVTVNGETTKTLNYAGFTAPLVAAVKGLLDKVETLEAKVQQLEADHAQMMNNNGGSY